MRKLLALAPLLLLFAFSCHRVESQQTVLTQEQANHAIAKLRAAYDAFNRGDIDATVRFLDKNVEWIEPASFPGGGTYHGIEGAKRYLAQSRAGAAEVISQPERFIPSGDRIVVFVYARVLPKGSSTWQEIRLADVYRFRHGKAVEMHAFADRSEALHWVGLSAAE